MVEEMETDSSENKGKSENATGYSGDDSSLGEKEGKEGNQMKDFEFGKEEVRDSSEEKGDKPQNGTTEEGEISSGQNTNTESLEHHPASGNLQEAETKSAAKSSIFNVYSKVFRLMSSNWVTKTAETESKRDKELDELVLPSNREWRHQVYYRLVELQRQVGNVTSLESLGRSSSSGSDSCKNTEWEPKRRAYPVKPKNGNSRKLAASLAAANEIDGSMTEACIEPGWRVQDITLAARVLLNEQLQTTYADAGEMRRVFGLVYDVLRYKQILNRALMNIGFWIDHEHLKPRERIVWLLLYDMHGRKFSRRGENAVLEKARKKAFQSAGLEDVASALSKEKTRLAASMSRLRIEGAALTLEELLPSHLRVPETVAWGDEENGVTSGWINTLKVSNKEEFIEEMSKLGLRCCEDRATCEISEDDYTFDPLCPKVVSLHEKAREKLAVSHLVRSHRLVLLDRSLCLGAAVLAHTIKCGRLCGPVVMTHPVAPRHTGYLVGLLIDIEEIGPLLVFGTGEEQSLYESYLENLGVSLQQCKIYAEKYISAPASTELERATVILANPLCSYTGVKDIVDLAVARNGDTSLFEKMTSMDDEIQFQQSHLSLSDQVATLKHALTSPNIQMLIYEVYTVVAAETTEMVEQVVEYANQLAAEKHSRNQSVKRKMGQKESGIAKITRVNRSATQQNQPSAQDQLKTQTDPVGVDEEDEATATMAVVEAKVPESDLFEIKTVNDIYEEDVSELLDKGCYLAILRRKEMMQFNSVFMIKVAESKGLFGDPCKQRQTKEDHDPAPIHKSPQSNPSSSKRSKAEIQRILAPTHSSMIHSVKENQNRDCHRHNCHLEQEENLRLTRIRETKRKDIQKWWEDLAVCLRSESEMEFQAVHTDSKTQKVLYPSRVREISFSNDGDPSN